MTLRCFLPSYLSYKFHKRALSKTNDLAKIADHKAKIKQLREVLFLHDAANGNIDKLKSSTKHGINVFVTDNNGNNALHLAALYNQKEVIPFLLTLGLNPRSRNFKDQSPLSIASSRNFGGALYYLQEVEKNQTTVIDVMNKNEWIEEKETRKDNMNDKEEKKDEKKKIITELTLSEIPPLKLK